MGLPLDGFLCCIFCCRHREALQCVAFVCAYLNAADSNCSLLRLQSSDTDCLQRYFLKKGVIVINIVVIKPSDKVGV